jgi:hypothetical protein
MSIEEGMMTNERGKYLRKTCNHSGGNGATRNPVSYLTQRDSEQGLDFQTDCGYNVV